MDSASCLTAANAVYAGDSNTECVGVCARPVLLNNYVLEFSRTPLQLDGLVRLVPISHRLLQVHFSGTLTLFVAPETLSEGRTLVLFEYAGYSGQFDEVLIEASGCLVAGRCPF